MFTPMLAQACRMIYQDYLRYEGAAADAVCCLSFSPLFDVAAPSRRYASAIDYAPPPLPPLIAAATARLLTPAADGFAAALSATAKMPDDAMIDDGYVLRASAMLLTPARLIRLRDDAHIVMMPRVVVMRYATIVMRRQKTACCARA